MSRLIGARIEIDRAIRACNLNGIPKLLTVTVSRAHTLRGSINFDGNLGEPERVGTVCRTFE